MEPKSNSERLAQMPRNTILTGPDEEFVRTHLLEPHPRYAEKVGPGVGHFRVVTGRGGSVEVRLFRVDGSSTALPHNPKLKRPRTQASLVAEAMREAVEPGRLAAKRAVFDSPDPRCALTGEPLTWDATEMDHFPTPFVALRDAWLLFRTLDELAVAKDEVGTPRYVMSDEAQRGAWVRFHDAQVSYRPLATTAHRAWTRQQQLAA